MAITVTYKSSIYNTAAGSKTCAPTWTPTANCLLVAYVAVSYSSSPVDPTGVTGHGVTYTKLTLGTSTLGTTHQVSVWVALAGGFSDLGRLCRVLGTTTGGTVTEFEVTGQGPGTAVQNIIDSSATNSGASGTSATVTLAAARQSANRGMVFLTQLSNNNPAAAGSWTLTAGAAGAYNTPATGSIGLFNNTAFDTAGAATVANGASWRMVGIEIAAAHSITASSEAVTTVAGTLPSLALGLALGAASLGLTGPAPTAVVDVPRATSVRALSLAGQAPTTVALTTLPVSDNFNDSSIDPGLWNVGNVDFYLNDPLVTVVETAVLTVTLRNGVAGDHYNGLIAPAMFDFTGAAVTVEVPTVPNQAVGGFPYCALILGFDDSDFAKKATLGVYTDDLEVDGVTGLAYNATDHRWWRIRHSTVSDRIYFETSPDGAVWTSRSDIARTNTITRTRVSFVAGTSGASFGDPGTAVLDNFSAALLSSSSLLPDAGALTLTGQTPVAAVNQPTAVPNGSLSFTGLAPEARVLGVLPFSDNFDDNDKDVSKWGTISTWNPLVTVVEASNVLTITPMTSAGGVQENGYFSVAEYDFTGAEATIDVVSALALNDGTYANFLILFDNDFAKFLYVAIDQFTDIYFKQTPTTATTIAFNGTTMRWWRIRHALSDDTIRWETSPDAVTWTQRLTLPRAYTMTRARFLINAGSYAPVSSPGSIVFDNFAANLDIRFEPDAGSLTLTGYTLTVALGLAIPAGTLTLTGQTPTASVPAPGTSIDVPCGTLTLGGPASPRANLNLTGYAPTLSIGGAVDTPISPAVGALVLAGLTPALDGGTGVAAGALVLTGQIPTVATGLSIPAGTLTLSGQTPATNSGTNVSAGSLTLTGLAPSLAGGAGIPAGALVLTGTTPSLAGGLSVPAGTLVLTGQTPSLQDGLQVATGALTLAGQTLALDLSVVVPEGVLTLQGQTPAMIAGSMAQPGEGALVLSGQTPQAFVSTNISPAAGTLTLTGQTPQALEATNLSPAQAVLTLTGQTPSLTFGLDVPAGTLTLQGFAPALDSGTGIPVGALVLAGQAPSLVEAINLDVPAGALTFTGHAPTPTLFGQLSPQEAVLTLTGYAPDLRYFLQVAPDPAALTLTGLAPVGSIDQRTAVAAGALVLSGQAPALALGFSIPAGTLTMTGQTPLTSVDQRTAVAAGTLTLSGQTPLASITVRADPAVGSLTITGQIPALALSLSVPAGTLTLSGQTPLRVDNTPLSPATGSLVLTGLAPTITVDVRLAIAAGALVLSGRTPSLQASTALSAGALVLTGQPPVLTIGSAALPGAGTLTLSGLAPSLQFDIGLVIPAGTLVLTGLDPLSETSGAVPTAHLVLTGQVPTATVGLAAYPRIINAFGAYTPILQAFAKHGTSTG